jgi:hypothetical protein
MKGLRDAMETGTLDAFAADFYQKQKQGGKNDQ